MFTPPPLPLPPTDDTLSAWLDKELAPHEQVQVTAWLEAHPQDAARVRLWAADREALRVRLDATLHEPVPAALCSAVLQGAAVAPGWRAPRWGAWPMAASFVVGLGLAWLVQAPWSGGGNAPVDVSRAAQPDAARWPQQAVAAHAVYVPEVRHPVEVSTRSAQGVDASQEAHLAAWLTKRLGRPIALFDLRAEGYTLVGGRLLPGMVGPSAQLMYQDAQGARVTVYVQAPGDAVPGLPNASPENGNALAQFRFEQRGTLGLFYWVETPTGAASQATGYALVGAVPKPQLLALAQRIDRQLSGP